MPEERYEENPQSVSRADMVVAIPSYREEDRICFSHHPGGSGPETLFLRQKSAF